MLIIVVQITLTNTLFKMATRANIQATIDTKLASAQSGGITAEQHRQTLGTGTNTVLSELYKITSIAETQATSNILTFVGTDWEYSLRFRKQGGFVHLSGTITNTSTTGRGGVNIAEFTNSEYAPDTDVVFVGDVSYDFDPDFDFQKLSSVKVTSGGFLQSDGIILGNTSSYNTININGIYTVSS